MSTWYELNREKAIENAKQWRLNNLEHYRQLQKAAKARKRGKKRAEHFKIVHPETITSIYPLAPEGYDPTFDGDLKDWCMMHNVAFDPSKW